MRMSEPHVANESEMGGLWQNYKYSSITPGTCNRFLKNQ